MNRLLEWAMIDGPVLRSRAPPFLLEHAMAAGTLAHLSPLDPKSPEPYYRQIYGRFRNAIASGTLNPGDRIPSARALTQELGLARGRSERASCRERV